MILIIDNDDSFTYNLVQSFLQLTPQVEVFQKDAITIHEIQQLSPELVVLSPGPGRPSDAGVSRDVLESLSLQIPVLGVCLGHQTIIEHFGGRVDKGSKPMHGKVSPICHNGQGIFANIPNPTSVTRYHSLAAVQSAWPECLVITARSDDGAVMALQHRTLPVTGIQFHPESILTIDGFQMLRNCFQEAVAWKKKKTGGLDNENSISAI
jgi:anthranilate synthase/aminodeoxychorismate synthase-like glutamine amidotransferase